MVKQLWIKNLKLPIKNSRILLVMYWCFNTPRAESLNCYKPYTKGEIKIVALSALNVLVWINQSQPCVAFLYPLKTENFMFSDIFRGYRKATPSCNGLMGKKIWNGAYYFMEINERKIRESCQLLLIRFLY